MKFTSPILILSLTASALTTAADTQVAGQVFAIGGPGRQLIPSVSGQIAVWSQVQGGPQEPWGRKGLLRGENLHTGQRFSGSGHEVVISGVAISGHTVVWVDCRHCFKAEGLPGYTNTKIYTRNLLTHQEYPVSLGGGDQDTPAISGDTVVWTEYRRGGNVIIAKNLTTGSPFVISKDGAQPALSGQIVVWSGRSAPYANADIYGKNMKTGRSLLVAKHLGTSYLTAPVISGSRVAWTRWNSNRSVSLQWKDLSNGRTVTVATIPAGHFNPQLGPTEAISGNLMVWDQAENVLSSDSPNFQVHGRNLITGKRFIVNAERGDQESPTLSGRTVLWVSYHGHARSNSHLFGKVLPANMGAGRPTTHEVKRQLALPQ